MARSSDDDPRGIEAENKRLRARVAELEAEIVPRDLERIADQIPNNIMILDREERIRYINWTVPDLTREDVIGTRPYDYVPADQRDQLRTSYRGVLETGEPRRIEIRYVAGDGSSSSWETHIVPLRRAGDVDGLVVVSTNITEREAAAADRDRFFTLSLDLLCVVSLRGRLTRVNPAFPRAVGWSEVELLSTPFLELIHPDDRPSAAAMIDRLAEGVDVHDYENRVRCADGSYKTIQWNAAAIPETGPIYGVGRDVTAHNALEAQLRQAQKMEAVGQLAGGIAHDFNNLLLAILLNTELAAAVTDEPSVTERLAEAKVAIERATDLAGRLLTFGRRQSGKFERLDLNELVRNMLQMLRRTLPASIAIDFQPTSDAAVVLGDRGQLEQVLLNLCINARDALRDNGSTIRIATARGTPTGGPASDGSEVLLTVSDDGEGMTPEVRERIFEPFFTTKRPGRGTGIGLAMVYGIVAKHGGSISVESEPGRGSSFCVRLPPFSGPSQVAGAAPLIEPPEVGRGELLLVAEDASEVRAAVVRLLEGAGYRVVTAADGHDAVERVRELGAEISLALLDVVMPTMSGPEAAAEIRALRPEIRIVLTSGYSDSSEPPDELEPVLRKPYEIASLLRRVRQELDDAAEEREQATARRSSPSEP